MSDLLESTLLEAAFEGVAFPVSDAKSDGPAHDYAEHVARGRRGADLEPTGLRTQRGTLTVPMLAGTRGHPRAYPDDYRALLSAIIAHPIGTLTHPTRGTMRAGLRVANEDASPDHRNGLVLQLEWIEHNGEASVLQGSSGEDPSDPATRAPRQAQAADDALADIGTTTALATLFDAQASLLLGGGLSFAQQQSAFATMLGAVASALALPVLNGVPAVTASTALGIYLARSSLETLRATTYQLQAAYMPQLARVRSYTTPRAMAVWEVALACYGDISLASLVLAANRVNDANAIPAGRVLTILPAS